MATTYCARPPPTPPTPPPTPPSEINVQELPLDFPLTDQSDCVWLSALSVAHSFRQPQLGFFPKVEPQHIAIALLYENIKNIDEVVTREAPILDIPLFWNAIQRAGVDPAKIGKDLRADGLRLADSSNDAQGTSFESDIPANSSRKTLELFDAAKRMMEALNDSFIAPHHLILAVLQDVSVTKLLEEHELEIKALEDIIFRLRTKKVRHQKTKPRFPVLEQFATDLTELAKAKKIGPIIGRDGELRRLIVILSRRTKNNAVLLGEPGVGKTAIAEGLALRIVNRTNGSIGPNRDVPPSLNARVFSLDMGSLLASTTCHGKLELRVKAILDEILENEENGVPIILFIDDLHLIMTGRITGGAGGMDAANLMKPLLARGKLRCFGATTFAAYERCMEADASLTRRFAQIVVCEPTARQTVTILRGLRKKLQEHHDIKIMDGAFVEAATLAHRYVAYRRLPDSAIDLVDEACSTLRVNRELKPELLEMLEKRRNALDIDIRSLIAEPNDPDSVTRSHMAKAEREKVQSDLMKETSDYGHEKSRRANISRLQREVAALEKSAVELENKAKVRVRRPILKKLSDVQLELKAFENGYRDHPVHPSRVTPGVIAQILAEQTSIPVTALISNEKTKYLDIEGTLGRTVIGQPDAVRAVSGAVHLSRSGLADPSRPIASFLLTGPSGTGKTFIAKELARILFQSSDRLLRINASEYSHPASLPLLIGTPPCTGFDRGGKLTECVKRSPFSVILVDNVEKACQEFIMKFQVIIDQGFLADGEGKVVDFRSCILLMTTGIGSWHLSEPGRVEGEVRQKILDNISQVFPPEFLSRLDDIIIFHILSQKDMLELLERRLDEMKARLLEKHIEFIADNTVKQYILSRTDSAQGVRGLERTIQIEISNRLPAIGPARHGRRVRFRLTLSQGALLVIQD